MIDPKFAEPLYDALCEVLNAIDDADVLEVGGQPLQSACKEADELLDEIDDYKPPMTPEAALSATAQFISRGQSEDADNLLDEIALTLNAMS